MILGSTLDIFTRTPDRIKDNNKECRGRQTHAQTLLQIIPQSTPFVSADTSQQKQTTTDIKPHQLLLESEVAERLGCSKAQVTRLRFQRKLAYVPGRPILVDEADLQAFIKYTAEAKRLKLERAEAETKRIDAAFKNPAIIALQIRFGKKERDRRNK